MNPTPWRRLLAAALWLAVLSSPARAEKTTADEAQTALQAGGLDRLYTGQRAYQTTVGIPPGNVTGSNAALGAMPDQSRIEACLTGGTLDAKQKDFYQQMLSRLQTSDEGKETLRRMVADCDATHQPISVRAVEFKGSTIVDQGVEHIFGINGMSTEENGAKREFQFNRLFLDFKDRDKALEVATANMGHELNHLLLHAEFRALLKDYSDVLHYALLDEQNARVKGFLVAYEVAKPGSEHNGDTRSARWLAENPQRYFDDMKTWDASYSIALQQKELRDPIKVYEARVKLLGERVEDDTKELQVFPVRLSQIDHMQGKHADVLAAEKVTDRVRLLKDEVASWQKGYPSAIQQMKDAITHINEMLARLKDPVKGPPLLAKLAALSYDPNYAQLVERHTLDIEKLKQLVKDKQLKDPDPSRQPMDVEEFLKLFEKLHGSRGAGPWNEKK